MKNKLLISVITLGMLSYLGYKLVKQVNDFNFDFDDIWNDMYD